MGSERIRIRISDDQLEAYVSIDPGEPAAQTDLEQALAAANVVYGHDPAAIARLAQSLADRNFSLEDECIAAGDPPKPGQDGQLDLAFQVGIQAGTLLEDDVMDFRERGLLKPVSEGERVASYRPPEPGSSGMSVRGEAQPAQAGEERLPELGSGVTRLSSGEIVAATAGVILYSPGKMLSVVSRIEHRADVDMRSGNLEMEGHLLIQGDIMAGFSVRATESVEVKGTVDGGRLWAGGSATVGGGVIGSGWGRVHVRESLSLRHANAADLYSGEELNCAKDLVNCKAQARDVAVKGRICGGEVLAERTIQAGDAGGRGGTATLLAVGELNETPAGLARKMLRKSRPTRTASARRVRGPRAGSTRSSSSKNRRLRRDAMCDAEKPDGDGLPGRYQRLRAARIEIKGTLFSGVTVRFGRRQLLLDENHEAVRLRYEVSEGEITMEKLK